jgi:hypothetical protein
MARCLFGVPLILLLASVASTQTPPQSDPKAVAFATQSIAALTNGMATVDVTLSGNAIWTTGTNTESGTATACGKTNMESRLDSTLSGGNRRKLRRSAGGCPQSAWINASGQSSPCASHNCWTDAVHARDDLHSPELFGTSDGSRPSVNHDVLYTE